MQYTPRPKRGLMLQKKLRHGAFRAFILESLDRRQLLSSYSTADYYPFAPGETWKYSVIDDGVAGTSTTTTESATYKGTPVLAFVESEKTDSNSTTTEYQTFSRSKGVRLLADFEVDADERLDVIGETAFLPGTLTIGTNTTFPAAAVTISLHTDDFDANGTGTANVTVSPKAIGSITTDSGLIFTDVIKVATHAVISYSLKSSAFKGSGKIDITDTSYYERGVGRVKSVSLGTQVITINGQSATQKVNMTELLTSSSRVGLTAKVANGAHRDRYEWR